MRTEQIVRSLAADLKPVRRLPKVEWRTVAWAVFAAACVAIASYALGPRTDLMAKLRDPAFLVEGALLLLVSLFAARSAFASSIPGAERSTDGRILPVMGLLVWVCVVAGGAAVSNFAPAWICIARMSALVFVPALAALWMLRRAAPLAPRWTGGLALLSAGSLALLGTRMLCPKDDPRHVLLWHFGPLLLTAAMGIRLGRWSLSRRT